VNGELAEELHSRNAELRRSNAELEAFAAVVSHDLAAPLTVVNGYLEVIGDKIEDDEQVDTWIRQARRAVGRMSGLITSLLSYARAGSAPCRLETADLGDLAEQAVNDLRSGIDGAVLVVPPDLPVVDCDPTLIRQLLQNLIGNALKYRHPDRACRVELSAERQGAEWAVSVTDNGAGIPAEQRARVFEMFTQIDPGAGTGHGVGLSTCQRIVDRHGGRIGATDTPGGGTTITFTLPARADVPAVRR
jgi:signal transduction histidine kinase